MLIPKAPMLPIELLSQVIGDEGYLVECPACTSCRVCGGSSWVTPEALDEWRERHPANKAASSSTIPAPPESYVAVGS
jgi:hypothetical protein